MHSKQRTQSMLFLTVSHHQQLSAPRIFWDNFFPFHSAGSTFLLLSWTQSSFSYTAYFGKKPYRWTAHRMKAPLVPTHRQFATISFLQKSLRHSGTNLQSHFSGRSQSIPLTTPAFLISNFYLTYILLEIKGLELDMILEMHKPDFPTDSLCSVWRQSFKM